METSIFCILLTLVVLTASAPLDSDSSNNVKRSAEPTLGLLLQKKLAKKALIFGKRSVADEDDVTIVKREAEPTLSLLLQKKLAKKALIFGKRSVADEDDSTIVKREAEPTLSLLLQKKLAKKALIFGKRSVADEDDIKAIINYIWCCYKANSFTNYLLNHLLSEMGLFTLHICCVSSSLAILKSYIKSKVDFLFQSFWLSL